MSKAERLRLGEVASRPERRGLFAPGDGGGKRRRASGGSGASEQDFIGFRKRRCLENEAGKSDRMRKADKTLIQRSRAPVVFERLRKWPT